MIKSYFLLGNKLILLDEKNKKTEHNLTIDQLENITHILVNIDDMKELQNFIDNELYLNDNINKIELIVKTFPDDFEINNHNQLLMTPYNVPVTDYIIDILHDSISGNTIFKSESLVNFYRMLMINPDTAVRDDIFKWFNTGQFTITENGFIIAYRDVNEKYKQNKLLMFASESITKYILAAKKIENKTIVQKLKDKTYKIVKESKLDIYETKYVVIGKLFDIYNRELQNIDKKMYTDQYTGEMDIKLLNEVSMDRKDCDNDPYTSCSKGLHGKSFNYGSNFGNTNLVMLVAPYDIVAIPYNEPMKFRCCAYTPICKTPLDENNKLMPFDEGTHDLSIFEGQLVKKTLNYLKDNSYRLDVIDTSELSKLQQILSDRIITLS